MLCCVDVADCILYALHQTGIREDVNGRDGSRKASGEGFCPSSALRLFALISSKLVACATCEGSDEIIFCDALIPQNALLHCATSQCSVQTQALGDPPQLLGAALCAQERAINGH